MKGLKRTQWMPRSMQGVKVAMWAAMLGSLHSVMAREYGDYVERGYSNRDNYYIERDYMEGPDGIQRLAEMEGPPGLGGPVDMEGPPGMEAPFGIEGPPRARRKYVRDYAREYLRDDDRDDDDREYRTDRIARKQHEDGEKERDYEGRHYPEGYLVRSSVDPMDCEMALRVPCRFDAHFTALALRPCGSALDYVIQKTPLPEASPSWKVFDIKPNYHFAFELGVRLQPDCMCGCFMVNWEHFHSQDTSSMQVPIGSEDSVGPFFDIPNVYNRARGRVKFHFDEVNVDYGVFSSMNDCLNANLYSGVSFVHIQRKLTSRYFNRDETLSRLIKNDSSFDGIGPQMGIDLTYKVCDGLCFTGGAAASLFFGRIKNDPRIQSHSPALSHTNINIQTPNRQRIIVHHSRQLIPGFEGRLGVGYGCERLDCSFRCEIGYFAQIYINALQSVDINSQVFDPPNPSEPIGVFARTFERHYTNFALAGPYVALGIRF